MPLYEFRCRTCEATFEERRPMSEANAPATCPSGHVGAVRVLSVFASVNANGGAPSTNPMPTGGGCCGGACSSH